MPKLTFEEALERIADGGRVDYSDVQTRALYRKIWIAEWHIPGCLSESQDICLTKRDAIQSAVAFTGADGSGDIEHKTRGIVTSLRKYGSFQHHTELFGHVNTTVYRCMLRDILA